MQEQRQERSLGELFGDLARDTGLLVRQEVRLATTEMTHKVTRVGQSLGFLVAGGAIAYAGFLVLLAALILGLGRLGLPWWVAALLVGIVVGGAGALMLQRGLASLKQTDLVPRQTIETLKEDAEWVKEQAQ